jgi:hypothetical protein
MREFRTALTGSLAALMVMAGLARGDYWYGDFTGDSTFTAETVALYPAPSDTAVSVMELPAGSPLTVTGLGEGQFDFNGFSSYWYPVRFEDGTVEGIAGYVPGAFLALSSLPLGGDTLFLFTVTGWDTTEAEYTGALRVLAGGEILDEIVFNPPGSACGQGFYSYNTASLPLDPSGLDGIRSLMKLSFLYNACSYANPDLLTAWTGTDLVIGPEGENEYEAGEYVFSSRFILPASEGGTSGMVGVEGTLGLWDEAVEDYVTSESATEWFAWDGAAFVSMSAGD